MATARQLDNGRSEILVYCSDGKRRTIRLGLVDPAEADVAAVRIQELAERQRDGESLSKRTLHWLDGQADKVRERLHKAGLAELPKAKRQRGSKKHPTLRLLIDRFRKSTADRKDSTQLVYDKVITNLLDHFGANTRIDQITTQDAKEWRAWLKTERNRREEDREDMAESTVSRRTGIARQIFQTAIDAEWIAKNPFKDRSLKVTTHADEAKKQYVPVSDILKVMDQTTDVEWHTLLALVRFAGFRCPSEIVRLKWSGIDLPGGWITSVYSPKTEHHPRGQMRRMPIFPDLRPFLEAAWDAAEKKQDYVLPMARDPSQNFRQQLERLIARAGVKQWPKLYVNLRASCIRDLPADCRDVKMVAKWMGNSEKVIMKHYLAIDDEVESYQLAKITDRVSAAREAAAKATL